MLSYLLFNPVRKLLEDRKNRIAEEIAQAASNEEEAKRLKAEYEGKLKEVDKEAEKLLSEARQKALKQEERTLSEARAEAERIMKHAREEAALEKARVADEMKQEMITLAAAMAGKVVAANINTSVQEQLVDETLKEMGGSTWQS